MHKHNIIIEPQEIKKIACTEIFLQNMNIAYYLMFPKYREMIDNEYSKCLKDY